MPYIITMTMPSGTKMAFSYHEENGKRTFALVPCDKTGVRNALAWDTSDEAEHHLSEQLKLAPDLKKLGPFTIEKVSIPQGLH